MLSYIASKKSYAPSNAADFKKKKLRSLSKSSKYAGSSIADKNSLGFNAAMPYHHLAKKKGKLAIDKEI